MSQPPAEVSSPSQILTRHQRVCRLRTKGPGRGIRGGARTETLTRSSQPTAANRTPPEDSDGQIDSRPTPSAQSSPRSHTITSIAVWLRRSRGRNYFSRGREGAGGEEWEGGGAHEADPFQVAASVTAPPPSPPPPPLKSTCARAGRDSDGRPRRGAARASLSGAGPFGLTRWG